MNKKQKTWIAAGAAVVVIIALVLLIASIRAQSGASTATSAYQTTTVQRGTLTSTVEGTGTVGSLLSASLNWLTTGQVDKVNVKIGDQVKAGQLLARLEVPELRDELARAKATEQRTKPGTYWPPCSKAPPRAPWNPTLSLLKRIWPN